MREIAIGIIQFPFVGEGGRKQGQLYIEVTQYSHQQGRRGKGKRKREDSV